MRDNAESLSGISSNNGKRWVPLFNAQTRAQMEWILRRKWNLGNSCQEIRLRSYRCYNTESRRFLSSKARRVSLVRLRRELRRFREIFTRDSI